MKLAITYPNAMCAAFLSMSVLACKPDSQNHPAATQPKDVSASASPSPSTTASPTLVGTWKNTECVAVSLDKNAGGSRSLWYHEALTFTETTFDSVNTIFVDATCTKQDSYQPSATPGGLLKYRLGDSIATDVRKMDFTSNVGTNPVFTVVSVSQNQLRLGDAKDASEDGKTENTRLTKPASRVYLKVDNPQ